MPPAPKTLLNDQAPAGAPSAAAASEAAPDPGSAAAIAAAANNRSASESSRFEGSGSAERPEFVPEKFWKDGKVDLETAFTSYKELETRFTTKTEDLLKQLDTERRKGLPEAPEKYEVNLGQDAPLPKEALEAHPSLDWWRKTAFEAGLPPEKFNEGVGQLVSILTAGPDLDAEKAALGENADARIAAVGQWAQSRLSSDAAAFEAVRMIGSTADGIRALEKLMGGSEAPDTSDAPREPDMTPEKVRAMQGDPRYWDRSKRDPAFVKMVDAAFSKLYPAKK